MKGLRERKLAGAYRLAFVLVCGFGLMTVHGCDSSGPAAGAGPNIDTSKRMVALTPDEEASLCDWLAGEWGGYGGSLRCDAGGGDTLSAPLSEPHCLMVLDLPRWTPSCPLTVGQFESCIDWQAQNVCLVGIVSGPMLPAECQLELGPACSSPMAAPDAG